MLLSIQPIFLPKSCYRVYWLHDSNHRTGVVFVSKKWTKLVRVVRRSFEWRQRKCRLPSLGTSIKHLRESDWHLQWQGLRTGPTGGQANKIYNPEDTIAWCPGEILWKLHHGRKKKQKNPPNKQKAPSAQEMLNYKIWLGTAIGSPLEELRQANLALAG